jgi:predicted dehydrogenase
LIKIGVIGCGFIAQIKHLPYLTGTEGGGVPGITVVAVCDIVKDLAEAMAQRYNIPEVYVDYHDMLDKSDIDAVAVLTEGDHTQFCVDAMNARKHVFTEKPLCYSMKGVEKILDAQRKTDLILQLGYMKRYDPGYEIAVEEFKKIKTISFVRAHKYLGGGGGVRNQILRSPVFHRTTPTDARPVFRLGAGRERIILEQLGEASEEEKVAYWSLTHIHGHVLNALFGIFGEPRKILRTEISSVGNRLPTISSLIEYPDWVGACEFGLPSPKKWDEFIMAYGERNVKVTFSHSWLKNRPAIVRVDEVEGDAVTRIIEGSYEEAFRREWDSFVKCIQTGEEPKVSVSDGERIVKICSAMISNYRHKETVIL